VEYTTRGPSAGSNPSSRKRTTTQRSCQKERRPSRKNKEEEERGVLTVVTGKNFSRSVKNSKKVRRKTFLDDVILGIINGCCSEGDREPKQGWSPSKIRGKGEEEQGV